MSKCTRCFGKLCDAKLKALALCSCRPSGVRPCVLICLPLCREYLESIDSEKFFEALRQIFAGASSAISEQRKGVRKQQKLRRQSSIHSSNHDVGHHKITSDGKNEPDVSSTDKQRKDSSSTLCAAFKLIRRLCIGSGEESVRLQNLFRVQPLSRVRVFVPVCECV